MQQGEGLICGREYHIVEPTIIHKNDRGTENRGYKGNLKPKTRFLVDGISHPKGLPIRFKSRERAERHIRNMGQDREFQSNTAT